jgi:hypothetical protein
MELSARSARKARIVLGTTLALVSLALLAAGGALLAVHYSQRDGDGFYSTNAHALSTQNYALVSKGLDIHDGDTDWLFSGSRLATIRVSATGTAAEPIFVGVARHTAVTTYLRTVAYDMITDVEVDPFSVTRTTQLGTTQPSAPRPARLWAKFATGSGTQTVDWPMKKGDWDVVVMNADASRGVQTAISVGAKVPLILWLGVILSSVGGLLLVGDIAGLAASRRRHETLGPATEPAVEGV